MVNATQLKRGQVAQVLDLKGPEIVVARLQELGVIRGASMRLVEVLTFGEPLVFDIDEVRLALRKSEAVCIMIQAAETIQPLTRASGEGQP